MANKKRGEKVGLIKTMVKKWLGINQAYPKNIRINETLDHDSNVLLNRLWYRGDPSELSQLYKSISDSVTNARFWAIAPDDKQTIRKIHSGLPALMVNVLTRIVINDKTGITIENEESQNLWNEIEKDNNFKKTLHNAVKTMLIEGDGAFKFSYDTVLSKYPIIEFYSGDRVDYTYDRGRLKEINFYTQYIHNNSSYTFIEIYGKGYINYKLLDKDGKETDLATIQDLAKFKDNDVVFNGDFILAVPMMLEESPFYQHRGQSIFEGKHDAFDAFDEIVSQWVDAVRLGRITKYIPEDLIPRDENGNKLKLNPLINTFQVTKSTLSESADPKAYHVTPEIRSVDLHLSYVTYMDMCINGIISPSTLGIDMKKLDNAEAQREKEKATLYSRDNIITTLEEVIPQVVNIALKTYNGIKSTIEGVNVTLEDYDVSITFGEYANPSFEAKIETLGKAYQFGVISIEQVVEEIYGDAWGDEEKQLEIARIKEAKTLATSQFNTYGMDNDESNLFNDNVPGGSE